MHQLFQRIESNVSSYPIHCLTIRRLIEDGQPGYANLASSFGTILINFPNRLAVMFLRTPCDYHQFNQSLFTESKASRLPFGLRLAPLSRAESPPLFHDRPDHY